MEGLLLNRMAATFRAELWQLRPRQHVLSTLSRTIPDNMGAELRASLLRWRGIRVGVGTLVHGTPEITGGESRGYELLSIGRDCVIDVGCAFEVGEAISIGDRVTIHPQVLVITTTHEIGPKEQRCGTPIRRPVRIEAGAVLGSRCVILPGVVIGAGAIVGEGSVVNKDVPANVKVSGIPAKPVENLP